MYRHRGWAGAIFAAVLILPLLAPAGMHAQENDVVVRVDPRVELLSIVFRLAGNPEYGQGRVPAYNAAIDEHFAPSGAHPTVELARQLREERGISFDAVMGMAIHLEDAFAPELAFPVEETDAWLYGDGRWTPAAAASFVTALNEFVADTDFRAFWESQATLYAAAERSARYLAAEELRAGWFADFFGRSPEAPFTMIPGLANGGANYGNRFRDARGREHAYAIIGVGAVDEAGLPVLRAGQLPTVIHEFNHSFVNPTTEPYREEFAEASHVYTVMEDVMRRQAYAGWHTVVNESLVRAAVVRYLRANDGNERAESELERQVDRGFLWIRELDALFGEYESDRDRWPTFASFMPRIVGHFEALAGRVDGMAAEREAAVEAEQRALDPLRPELVSVEPADGSRDVDPETSAIVLRFDRPMSGAYQLNPAEGWGFPETTGLSWNEDQTVLTLEVRLEPDADYALVLNRPTGGAFRSADEDIPLRMTTVRFRTR